MYKKKYSDGSENIINEALENGDIYIYIDSRITKTVLIMHQEKYYC